MLRLLKSLFESRPHRVVGTVAQGDHGVHPPLQEIHEEVERWVNALLAMEEERLAFSVHVECRRIPAAKGFQGVRAIVVPSYNPSSVELRVRPPKSEYQWQCHLVCLNPDIAHMVLCVARPEACQFLLTHQEVEAQVGVTREERREVRRRLAAKEGGDAARLTPRLRQRAILRELCGGLRRLADKNGLIGDTLLKECLSQVLNIPLPGPVLYLDLLAHLVDEGVLDPVDAVHLRGTPLFGEYADAFALHQEQELQEGLQHDLARLQRLKAANREQREKHEQAIVELDRQHDSLRSRITEISHQLKGS